MIISGRVLVTEVGKPVPLSIDSKVVSRIMIFSVAGQSGTIAVGDSNVSQVSGNETGMPLTATDYIDLTSVPGGQQLDLSEIYIDSSVVDEGVRWLAMV